ncbi:MAG: DUF1207 domain-containing protein [Lacipirellulaceae bacterium]
MSTKLSLAIALGTVTLLGALSPSAIAKAPPFTSRTAEEAQASSDLGSKAQLSLGPQQNEENASLADQIILEGEGKDTIVDGKAQQVQYQQALSGCDFRSEGCGCGDCNYQWRLLPQGVIYRSYLAGVNESRFRSVWNDQDNDGDNWDISLGGRATILRYGTGGDVRPEGFEIGIEGAGLTRLDPEEDHDVSATDYRFGIPVTWGDARRQFKVAYYHLSSHVGDEFLIKNPGFTRLNYSRDVLVLGYSVYPDENSFIPGNGNLRFYGEMGYAFVNDVSEPWEFQFGIDYAPTQGTGFRGAPFVAFNGHLREEVDFGGNFVAQAGWAWRRSAASGLLRFGFEYYNGKDDQFSFFDNSVQKTGFGIWYDY